jgi:hypothetical protein
MKNVLVQRTKEGNCIIVGAGTQYFSVIEQVRVKVKL